MTTRPDLPEYITPTQLLEALKVVGITNPSGIELVEFAYNAVTVHWHNNVGGSYTNIIPVRHTAVPAPAPEPLAAWEKELLAASVNPVVEDTELNKKKPIKIKRPR